MSRFETMSIDRRPSYYAKAAEHIAADPLDFYTRSERGRRWQADIFSARNYEAEAIATAQNVEPEYCQ